MKYAAITAVAISFVFFAHAMESEEFHKLFIDTRKQISPWSRNIYFETINNIFEEARNKKAALSQLDKAIAQRRDNGISNHILVDGKPAPSISFNDEALNCRFNDLMTNYVTTLSRWLKICQIQYQADILKVELALATRIGMCSDPQQIADNTQLKNIETYWSDTHKNLGVMQLSQDERKLLELLIRKEPVSVEDLHNQNDIITSQTGSK